jgi:hypothetical protein
MIAEMIVMIPTIVTKGKDSTVIVALVFAIVFGSLIYLLATTYCYYLKRDPEGFGPHAPTLGSSVQWYRHQFTLDGRITKPRCVNAGLTTSAADDGIDRSGGGAAG